MLMFSVVFVFFFSKFFLWSSVRWCPISFTLEIFLIGRFLQASGNGKHQFRISSRLMRIFLNIKLARCKMIMVVLHMYTVLILNNRTCRFFFNFDFSFSSLSLLVLELPVF